MKKSYNPFRMWGAWAGAGIGLLYSLGDAMRAISGTQTYGFLGRLASLDGIYLTEKAVLIIILGVSLGFLVGWGVHSLVRRYK